jgi:iron complex outermembrane receptor protein
MAFNPKLYRTLDTLWGETNLTVGGELEYTDYELVSVFGPQTEMRTLYALYAQLSTNIAEDWQVTLGLRHTGIRSNLNSCAVCDDELTLGSAGITYAPSTSWQIFARWDQNYRFATVDEHTNIFFGQPVGLNTQRGTSYELGFKFEGDNWHTQVQGYQLDLQNEINFDSSGFININLYRTQRRGLLVDTTWSPGAQWTLGAEYSYMDSQIRSTPAAALERRLFPLVPRQQARVFINHILSSSINLQGTARWTSARAIGGDFTNSFPALPAYWVIDMVGYYKHGPWNLSLRLDNLLDQEYNESGAVGFDSTFMLRDAYFPATGRSFWFTFGYDW